MKRTIALVAVLACHEKPEKLGPADEPEAREQPSGCPLKMPANAQARFAVGINPVFVGGGCSADFTPDEKILTATNGPKLIAEGVFTGACGDGQPNATFVAVKPDHLVLEVVGGVLGAPIELAPAGTVEVLAHAADRCNDPLRGDAPVTWELKGCDQIASIPTGNGPTKYTGVVITAVGPGSCKLVATMLAVTGVVPITVK